MIETILVVSLILNGWQYLQEPTKIECKPDPLITSQCVDIEPPTDKSFGAAMNGYSSLVTTYRKCKAACVSRVE